MTSKKSKKAKGAPARKSKGGNKGGKKPAKKPALKPAGLAPRALTITGGELEWVVNHLRSNLSDMLRVPMVSAFLAVNRLGRTGHDKIATFDGQDGAVIDHAAKYNREELIRNSALLRPYILINALMGIYYVFNKAHGLKVLSIGPRSESELFMLYGAGFHPDNVSALDLISYSELVDLGDMHDMPYPDNSFDIIILGWVLGYSRDPQKVADEVVRVARPGAFVAIGCERSPPASRHAPSQSGIVLDGTYFEKTQEYVDLFKGHVFDVPVRHEVHRKMQNETCHVIAIIELK